MIIRTVDSVNDWNFGKGLSDYAFDEQAIAQNISSRLLSWLNDAFFATNEGVDWLGRLDLRQRPALEQELKTIILQSYGVISVTSVTVSFSGQTRLFTATYNIDTFFSQNFQATLSQAVGG